MMVHEFSAVFVVNLYACQQQSYQRSDIIWLGPTVILQRGRIQRARTCAFECGPRVSLNICRNPFPVC